MLEPAGSRGVWGLDDHQFLSYYWGSAQLQDHKRLKPKSILSEELVNKYSSDYIYFGCIKYIREVKKGPFHEHSPLLYDISEVPNWSKVNSGLMKMYIAEVLKKFPIVQHFVFGSLLPFKPVIERQAADQ
ncbi:1450_t:CDS:2 [Gigaspora rosea]|nr:1450_t:CDS:2 [Gigaspora rosea]